MSAKKDNKYFIDKYQYNCPYCQTGAVRYAVKDYFDFDWTKSETKRCILIQCQEPKCGCISLHMTEHLSLKGSSDDIPCLYGLPPIQVRNPDTNEVVNVAWEVAKDIDDLFFYHHPNSTFVVDERIPKNIRTALDEANTSHKMGLFIGASASLRKAIFELLAKFDIPKLKEQKQNSKDPNRFTYYERLDLLKKKIIDQFPSVDSTLFDDIKQVYSLVSQPLHERLPDEEEWKDFTSAQFLFLMEVVNTLLIQLFVVPDENKERKQKILSLAKGIPNLKISSDVPKK